MDPFTDTSTLPLSIAHLDPAIYTGAAPGAGLPPRQESMLSAVAVRAGEVEAAEWALDQAKAACDAQIAAALFSGLPAERVALAAGLCASALDGFIENQMPVPAAG